MQIGILSDTHGLIPQQIYSFFANCDEVWHAGDWGSVDCYQAIKQFKPTKAVYGNIDNQNLRAFMPQDLIFTVEGIKVVITHIGGYPGKYTSHGLKLIKQHTPDLFVCGHSHILKVIRDKQNGLLHINPGAAGVHGFHVKSTAIRLNINQGKLSNLEVWESNLKSLPTYKHQNH